MLGLFFTRLYFLFRTCKISIVWSIFFQYSTSAVYSVHCSHVMEESWMWLEMNVLLDKMINSSFSKNYHGSYTVYVSGITAGMIPERLGLGEQTHTHSIEVHQCWLYSVAWLVIGGALISSIILSPITNCRDIHIESSLSVCARACVCLGSMVIRLWNWS